MKDLDIDLGFSIMPAEHTCDGRNISPKIVIRGLDAISLAVVVVDPDAPSGSFTHWVAWNIPPSAEIPEGIPNTPTVARPVQAAQGRNSFGKIGYMGPCPPPGRPHRYIFRVYGLDTMLDLRPGATRQELERAVSGHILQQGEAIATYGR